MNKVVLDFYDQLQHDEELKNKIAKEVLLSRAKNNNLTVEEELNKIVIPIAKEHGFNLSAKDIIDYEKKNESSLSEDDLEEVTGGFGRTTLATGMLTLVGLSGVIGLAGNMSSVSAENSDMPSVVEAVVPEDTGAQNEGADKEEKADFIRQFQAEGTKKKVNAKTAKREVITKEIEANEYDDDTLRENLVKELSKRAELLEIDSDFNRTLQKDDLHNPFVNVAAGLIKVSNKRIALLSSNLDELGIFQACKNRGLLKGIFKEIKDRNDLNPRCKVAMMLILDNLMKKYGVEHDTSVTANVYFVDTNKGEVVWPDNSGAAEGTEKEVTDKLTVGCIIDRYGDPFGKYVSPMKKDGTSYSFGERGLSQRDNKKIYHKYQVTRSFNELNQVLGELGLGGLVDIESHAQKIYVDLQAYLHVDFQTTPSDLGFSFKQCKTFCADGDVEGKFKEGITEEEKQKFNLGKEDLSKLLEKLQEEFEHAKEGKDEAEQEKITKLKTSYEGGFINAQKSFMGASVMGAKIAPAFRQNGGGEQWLLPMCVQNLIDLGFLAEF